MNTEKYFRLATRLSTLAVLTMLLASSAAAEWHEKVLYSFQGGSDGQTPAGGVVFDKAGNLYGATVNGGADNCSPMAACGTVFQLAPPANKGEAWTETVLYVFKGKASNDGENPDGGLVMDAAGNLYGTAAYGGTGDCVLLGIKGGCGTVYKMSPPAQKGGAWTETTLYSFKGGNEGYVPQGNLVFDSAGNLYGVTLFGGGKGTTCDPFYQYCGTVFELSPPKQKGGEWAEKVLHSFAGGPTDGANPNGGLVLDSTGAIYGTAAAGGNQTCKTSGSVGCGTVFELTSAKKGGAWTEKILHRFNGQDGANPAAGVVLSGKGDLYCTAANGGGGRFPSGSAVQFVPQPSGKWTEHMLHSFQDNSDGGEPQSGLVFDSMGNLYGTASGGGKVGNGTFLRLRPTGKSWAFTALYEFAAKPDGAYPSGSLIFDGAGNIYGTTQYGGSGQACGNYGCGTVFRAEP